MNGKGLMYIIQRKILFGGLFQNNTFILSRIYYPDLTYYEGDIINNRKNGYGKIVFNDGFIFQRNFKYDLFDEINQNQYNGKIEDLDNRVINDEMVKKEKIDLEIYMLLFKIELMMGYAKRHW